MNIIQSPEQSLNSHYCDLSQKKRWRAANRLVKVLLWLGRWKSCQEDMVCQRLIGSDRSGLAFYSILFKAESNLKWLSSSDRPWRIPQRGLFSMTHLPLWSHSSEITTFMHKHYVSADQTTAKNKLDKHMICMVEWVCLWLLPNISHLYLQQLLLVGGVHLLQGLLQFMVPVQEGFPQLCCQVEICPIRSKNVNTRYGAVSVPKHGERIELHLCKGY